ncbi:MAG: hypothetical protein U1F49_19890 [Rubrivivax sp.]
MGPGDAELAAVKQIKSVVPGATVNDAVIAMIGGAMRRYLLDKKELPAKSLVTLAPVNTREKAQRDASGNTILGGALPALHRHRRPDRAPGRGARGNRRIEGDACAIGARDLTDVQFIPPATLAWRAGCSPPLGAGGKGPLPLHNRLVTNAGPTEPLHMLAPNSCTGGGRPRSTACR